MKGTSGSIQTKLIHAGEPKIDGAVSMPIYQTATYEFKEREGESARYIRYGNTPDHAAIAQKLSAIENAESALVCASGMAAISNTFFTFLTSGDRILSQREIYAGTYEFFTNVFPKFGIQCDFIDAQQPDAWKKHLTSRTRAIYCETITNPLMQVIDLPQIVSFAKEHELISIIDNTFATPVNFRPAEIGFDISIHSGTKYLNGHSDIAAGAVIGRASLIDKIKKTVKELGALMDPHVLFLLNRGLKTMYVRVKQQNESALRIAAAIEKHPAVRNVNYPGLHSSRFYKNASGLLDGFGGMVGLELHGGRDEALRFMQATTIPLLAGSLGGVETLMSRPAATTHSHFSPEERKALGISDSLIRLSVGLESADELVEDLLNALGNKA